MRALLVVALVACSPPAKAPPSNVAAPAPALAPRTAKGPLARAHAALDRSDGCLTCHTDDQGGLSNAKCLACHEHDRLRLRIAANRGFHSSARVRNTACWVCHEDHRGRSRDISGWSAIGGSQRFDHAQTGWLLHGKHATTACIDCHPKEDAYANADPACASCHVLAQPHGSERTELLACDRCHTSSTWRRPLLHMKFDHDDRKDARMPLIGVHKGVACAKCHPAAQFKLAVADPTNCKNCHASPHGTHLFGQRPCDWCHAPTFKSMKKTQSFNHQERSRFDLGLAHKQLACDYCHTQQLAAQLPDPRCENCHAADSPHGMRFGLDCGACHVTAGPPSPRGQPKKSFAKVVFDHGKHTRFRLVGRHVAIGCRACHTGPTFQQVSSRCTGCHPSVHDSKYGDADCAKCHW